MVIDRMFPMSVVCRTDDLVPTTRVSLMSIIKGCDIYYGSIRLSPELL